MCPCRCILPVTGDWEERYATEAADASGNGYPDQYHGKPPFGERGSILGTIPITSGTPRAAWAPAPILGRPESPNLSSTPNANINIRKAQVIVGGIAYADKQIAKQTLAAQIATVVNIGAGAHGPWKAVAASWPAVVRVLARGRN